jgi:hypothetical protein
MKMLLDADMPAMELGGLQDYPETPTTLLVDSDGVEHAFDKNGVELLKEPLPWETVRDLAKGRFISILTKSEAGGFEAYLSRGETFRHKLATILKYKGNRDGRERPFHSARIKQYYADTFGAQWCDGYEADDGMAMEQWGDWSYLAKLYDYNEERIKENSNTVICSRDKDLNTVPGWHFNWTLKKEAEKREMLGEVHFEKPPYYVTLMQSIRNFYTQMLMGDSVDNIKGLYNVGKKSAWIKQLDDMHDEPAMYEHVKDKYQRYYGNWWREALVETGRLLHMLRKPGDVWLPPDERDNNYYEI